jgi:microcin C transport system substrate-binding protein
MHYDIYRDETVMLEAFKAGNYDFREEMIARNWATAYNFPAIRDGRVIKRVIPNEVPQGMQCFVFNERRSKLSDRRVREAIDLAFDFEWMNKALFYNAYKRNTSFFGSTQFEAKGLPSKGEIALLEPYKKDLPPELFTQVFHEPATDGSGNARANLLKAAKLLDDAGWVVKNGKRVNAKTGEKLTLEFLLVQPSMERIVSPLRKNLERLGIDATIRTVDDSQYQKRLDSKDFDVISQWFNRNVFYPGFEQKSLWHSSQADIAGSINYAGTKSPVIDMLVDRIVTAKDLASLTDAARALDRVLLWEHVVLPHYRFQGYRVAYRNIFGMPKTDPKYALGIGFWWIKK